MLGQTDINNMPISDTEWNKEGDTPHSIIRPDGLLTCETIWKATSNSGDYHDNMSSDLFMKWVEEKLIPTFQAMYGIKKKMILVCDNAAYHHKRELGSLASMTKKNWFNYASIMRLNTSTYR